MSTGPPYFFRRIMYLIFLTMDIRATTKETQVGWLIFGVSVCIMFITFIISPDFLADVIYKAIHRKDK